LNAYDSPVYNFINLNGQGAKRKEQPQYLISSASFNQFSQSSLFMYTTSNGNIHICDVRERSDFTKKSSITLQTQHENQPSVYAAWLNYVSTASFLLDPNLVVSREYMNVR
jgi:hypothetical protein